MTQQVISLLGTTATGKTETALRLAQDITNARGAGVDIVSADSRQVYRELPLLTGADVPSSFSLTDSADLSLPFWQHQSTRIHGIGCIDASSEWSVSHFRELVAEVINLANKDNRQVILVGGTGLYHRLAFETDPRLRVPPQSAIRQKAATASVAELQAWAEKVDSSSFLEMNNSDRHNPRRLVRLIEKASVKQPSDRQSSQLDTKNTITHRKYQLYLPIEEVTAKIQTRISLRLAAGIIEEVQTHCSQVPADSPLASATGYAQVLAYLDGEIDLEVLLAQWQLGEVKYAKQQLTWLKSEPNLHIFDLREPGWYQELIENFSPQY